MGNRNSYSKTDPDATFMRMKDDHMKNGQLKPGYNLQASTNNQYVVHYSLHPNPTDTLTLIPHLEQYEALYSQMPDQIVADSGYGSEENYQYLADEQINALVKYNTFYKETTARFKKKYPFHPNSLHYNEEQDYYVCPMGQKMHNMGTSKRKTASGYEQTYTRYQAQNCQGCPLRSQCHKSKENRIISISHKLKQFKAQAREKLDSPEGIEERKRRNVEVEAAFGILKHNHHFRRLMLRGNEKVEVEVGLHAIAHNCRKLAANRSKKKPNETLFPWKGNQKAA